MFEKYLATKKDFQAIEEGIETVWRPEMDFIFRDKSLIENVVPISFDSRFFYIWSSFKTPKLKSIVSNFGNYQLYNTPHKLKIYEYDQMGWCANAEKWRSFLPKSLQKSKKAILISGGLLTPFTKIHKKYLAQGYPDIYHSRESYLATLVHEFAHIYYNSIPLSSLNRQANLKYLKAAINLFKDKRTKKLPRIKTYRSFVFDVWTETFAFGAECHAASIFWPRFKKDSDNYWMVNLQRLINNPSFLTSRQPHSLAAVIGKIILTQYPKTWPQILT